MHLSFHRQNKVYSWYKFKCRIYKDINVFFSVNEQSVKSQALNDEIIFYSNGSIFSPVIVIEGEAQILWTWDDDSTSNSFTPIKDYGSSKLRKNTLKVTPWSAVRRINIGYDAEEGGSPDIELVQNQFVAEDIINIRCTTTKVNKINN